MYKITVFLLFASLCVASLHLSAQQHFTISGYVKDAKTGEHLIGATITVAERQGVGSATNAYGFFSLTLPAGNYTVNAQFIGYDLKAVKVNLHHTVTVDVNLEPKSSELNEVVVSAHRPDENITKIQMGVQKLNTQEMSNVPVLFGEKDLLKTIQLLPGIQSAGDGGSGFYVRGGGSDQNLILLDEATVYNATHLMGFFSVFNSDAIKDVSVYKGNEPAEYGGRLSSVVDVKMNDGNDKTLKVNGGIGLISSHVTVEGPIVKDKGSFIVSARRTYADLFLKLSKDSLLKRSSLYFYDLNAKANYEFDRSNRLYLSGYFGKDVLGLSDMFGINWGNKTLTVRWNHLFSDKIFSNTSLIFSDYNYNITVNSGLQFTIISRIQDYTLKEDFQYYMNEHSTLKWGVQIIRHHTTPGTVTSTGDNVNIKNLPNKQAWENSLYLSHQYIFSPKFSAEYGLRATLFQLMGPGTFYSYDADGNVSDSASYGSGKAVKSYLTVEPRISLNYKLTDESSLKASYATNSQNMHLLSNSTSGRPTDLWVPSSNNVKPEIAEQVAVGYYRNFSNNLYEFSAELYYKNLYNQINFKNGAQLIMNANIESQIISGTGRAYGLELYFKKTYGRFNGWISYTLSRSERKFAGINNGNYFPSNQDRTHDISVVGIYNLNKKWMLSATWVYNTGNAVTFPAGKYSVDGTTLFYYTQHNADRMPAYHRLDLGATWITKKTKKYESSWTFSLYNAYGHDNAYMIQFQNNPNDPDKTQAVQTTLFKMVPSVSFNFKF